MERTVMTYLWLECEEEIEKWKKYQYANLKVAEECFFNNANIILKQECDFRQKILSCLNGKIEIIPTIRSTQRQKEKKKYLKKYKGIDINYLNTILREKLRDDNSLLFEVYNEDGVFYTSNRKKGFDFAKLDAKYNLIKLWNQCFGKRALYNGETIWEDALKQNDFLQKALENIDLCTDNKGQDVEIKKEIITVLGEIQFGNWGLVYRDLFKLLDADNNSGVDLFIYVTAHNSLLSAASDNIVSFDETNKILSEFSNLVKIPVWVIGLDIEF